MTALLAFFLATAALGAMASHFGVDSRPDFHGHVDWRSLTS